LDGSLTSAPGVSRPAPSRVEGYLERAEPGLVAGWAWMPDEPEAVVAVDVLVGGKPVARLAADRFRADLQRAGRGTGRYGFQFTGLSVFLDAGREAVAVRVAEGGADLAGSPRLIEAPGAALDAAATRFLESAVAAAARAATAPADLDAPLALLMRLLAELAAARARLREADETALDQLATLGAEGGPVAALAAGIRARFAPIPGLAPAAAEPRVSVIIPAHGRFELTYACIAAIAAAGADAPFEIVLVDDGSADETLLADFVFGGAVRVVRTRRNAGFLRAANAGAAAARGDTLLFLNNDTEPQPGWLDELLGTLDRDPGIGIAGAALVYPDGALQECGGLVGRFAEATNRGRGADPDDPRFRFLRDADYVSGAALIIRRDLFARLGGFDEEFAPGYYEDTDLCFRVRHEAGLRVVVQPQSRVIHHEGGTAGRDTDTGMKRHQLLNQRRFHRRWRHVLEAHRPAGEDVHLEAERHIRHRALFVDECTPTPHRDAGSNAAFEHMRLLQSLGHQVGFVAASDPRPRPGYTAALERLGIECHTSPHVASVEDAFRRQQIPPDVVYLHRGSVAARYLPLARYHFPDATVIYSVADLHFLRLSREADLAGDDALRAEAARSEAMELAAAAAADRVIVHSPAEASILAERAPAARVHVLPWTVRTAPVTTPLAERHGVGFLGGYAHRPNVDAALHLVRDVMPEARRRLPDLPCLLLGADLPREFAALAGIEPVGFVPDLARTLGRLRCTVAPLRYGAGIKGKVLTSLAHGVPCVMTPIAAEGLALPDRLRWLVAEAPAALADRIAALHRDDALAADVAAQGLAWIEAGFGEAAMRRGMAAILAPSPA